MKKINEKSKILLSMNLGNLGLLLIGAVAYYFFVFKMKGGLIAIYPPGLGLLNWLWLVVAYIAMVVVFWALIKIKSPEYFYDEAVDYLMKNLSMPQLVGVFLLGGLSEELIFRGVIQLWVGLIPSSIIFVLIHFRYLKKPWMALETLALSLILGSLYIITESIWICSIAHALINLTTAWIIKSGKIDYRREDGSD